MPQAIVDPIVQAQGSIPASPLSAMMSHIVGVYGRQFPTPLERSEMQYKNAATQQLQQQNSAPQELQDIATRIYSSPASMAGAAVQNGTDGNVPLPSTDQRVRDNLPETIGTLARAGQYSNLGSAIRTIVANAPGVTYDSGNLNHPSPVSAAMVGSGESPLNTPEAMSAGMTPAARDRAAKINNILQNNPSMAPSRAANIVDDVLAYPQDPTTKTIFEVNKGTGEQVPLRLGNTQIDSSGNVQQPGDASAPAPAVAPAVTTSPSGSNNNPFNLRPVGSSTGMQSFPNQQAGILAGLKDLTAKISGNSPAMGGKAPTVRNIISTYSPPNENNTAALIQNAAQRMGVDPDQQLTLQHLVPLADAVLQQEGNGTGARPPTTPPSTPAGATRALALQRGQLGIPFDSIYGGPATAGRIAGGIGAVFGNSEANNGATSGLTNVNDIKNQLISIKNLQMGMRTNSAAQARFAQQFPETDPQLLDTENLASGATTGSGTAEDQIIRGLQGAVVDRISDAQVFANPNTAAEERQYAQERMNKTDKLFAGLPKPVRQLYQAAISGQQAAASSNLQQGQATTTIPAGKVRVMSPDGKQTGFIDRGELSQAVQNGWKAAQ